MADTEREQQYYIDIVSGLAERTIKRLWIVILVQILVMVGMVAFYIWHESQYIDVEETITQEVDTGEGAALVSGTGDVICGESKANS